MAAPSSPSMCGRVLGKQVFPLCKTKPADMQKQKKWTRPYPLTSVYYPKLIRSSPLLLLSPPSSILARGFSAASIFAASSRVAQSAGGGGSNSISNRIASVTREVVCRTSGNIGNENVTVIPTGRTCCSLPVGSWMLLKPITRPRLASWQKRVV